ncbi:MAG: Glucose-6-phosphate 1-dehydrogenase [Candidatus Giovannonibacteria bacterium GW2011_GWA2_45_21]|uniref:Glucose-6-phosphate 1-dehydrogenase n=1 Tax=Candidatus Giovannonibacteria bacterium GW2011_GWA2_45_21 TaxID=1618649 RepID=A0A0G1M3S5_9BACT|nr:MAG: Glucose-6-phosphate 1-dehydrogenase [Candidatus Giovannonibacteria bacterium GW2011_GWA2_45_21]
MQKEPISLVVFGATGDLMARKILPSLFYLFREKKLSKGFRVVGISRRDISKEGFREKMREAAGKFDEIAKDKKFVGFLKLFYFVKGYFGDKYTYEDLKKVLEGHDHKIFFYLAVAPKFYKTVLENMKKAGLIHKNMFLLVEKPIGLDLKSAREIENLLAKYFNEWQIYRIDHYLAKSGMDALFNFRFGSPTSIALRSRTSGLLEKIWSREYISKIELRLWEKKDVGTRGEFYEGVGALRDVGQNHLLTMLAYVAMEKPKAFHGEAVRKARAALLQRLKIYNLRQAAPFAYRAQYSGYRDAPGVKRNSKAETFFRVTAFLNAGQFRGVPITIEAGKAMPENKKEIVVKFRDGKNIIFQIETRAVKYQYVEEYKKILAGAFSGDDSIFLGRDEVLVSWKFVDPIVLVFKKNLVPLKFYEQNAYPKI